MERINALAIETLLLRSRTSALYPSPKLPILPLSTDLVLPLQVPQTEALFVALGEEAPSRYSAEEWEALEKDKEHLCDYGAAEFLLPAHLFFPLVSRSEERRVGKEGRFRWW